MAAPYVTVRDKASKEIIVTGSVFDIVKHGFTGPGPQTVQSLELFL